MTKVNHQLLDLLASEKLASQEDVGKLKIGGSYDWARVSLAEPNQAEITGTLHQRQFVSSSDYPWVKDLYFLVRADYEKILQGHGELGEQGIVVGEPYGNWGYHSWKLGDPVFGMRAKLACLFPKRVLLLTEKFVFNEDDGTYWIPVDFLIQAVEMSSLLRGGYAHLLPKRLRIERDVAMGALNENDKTSYHYMQKGKFIGVPNSGYGMEDLEQQTRNFDQPLDFLLNLPWLLTKDVRHCVDIMEKHRAEFTIYSDAVTNALSVRDPAALQKWALEVVNSSKEIDVIYANKMKELRAKGWETLAGILPSVLAFALPDSQVKQVLAPLVAGKTVVDGARWFYDMQQAKNLISKEKNWIIWRMQH